MNIIEEEVIKVFKEVTESIDAMMRKSSFRVECVEHLNCFSEEVFLEGIFFRVFGLEKRKILFLDVKTVLEKYNGSINIKTYLILEIIKLKEMIINDIEKEFLECVGDNYEK